MARLQSGPHSPPIDPIIREWYCDQVPRPNTRPVNIQFLEWFRRDCDFLSSHSQIGWQCDRFATYRAASRTGRTLSLATLGGDACAGAATRLISALNSKLFFSNRISCEGYEKNATRRLCCAAEAPMLTAN